MQRNLASVKPLPQQMPNLSPTNEKFLAKVDAIAALDEEDAELDITQSDVDGSSVSQIHLPKSQISQFPCLNAFYGHYPINTNTIKADIVSPHHKKHSKLMASHPLQLLKKQNSQPPGSHTFFLEPLIIDNRDNDILAGVSFMIYNDITMHSAKHQVILSGKATYYHAPDSRSADTHTIWFTKASVVCAPSTSTPHMIMIVDMTSSWLSSNSLTVTQ